MRDKNYSYGVGLIYNNDRVRALEDGEQVQFRYPKPFELHYKFRHLIDNHNNKRHAVPSIEWSLKTHHWAMRCFQYLLATLETILYLAMKHFAWGGADEFTILQFWQKLAWKLINNPLLTEQRPDLIATRCRTNPLVVHNVAKCPPFTSCWNDRKFEITPQFRYNQFTCKSRGCKKRVRAYCVCTPGEWLCSLHWRAHLLVAAAI